MRLLGDALHVCVPAGGRVMCLWSRGRVPALSAVRQRCLAPNCFNIVINIIVDMFPSFLLFYIKLKYLCLLQVIECNLVAFPLQERCQAH